jgi:hypothetical protein
VLISSQLILQPPQDQSEFLESDSIPIGTDMGGAGFEPAKAVPPDLQSGPFGRLGIHPVGAEFQSFQPMCCFATNAQVGRSPGALPAIGWAELAVRLELTTLGLQNRSSAD